MHSWQPNACKVTELTTGTPTSQHRNPTSSLIGKPVVAASMFTNFRTLLQLFLLDYDFQDHDDNFFIGKDVLHIF